MKIQILAALSLVVLIGASDVDAAVSLKLDAERVDPVVTEAQLVLPVSRTTDTAGVPTGVTAPTQVVQLPPDTNLPYTDADKDGGTTEEKKGKVDMTWKVEEGQKAGPALLEIDGIKGESPDKPKPQKGEEESIDDVKNDTQLRGGINIAVGDVNGDGVSEDQKQAFLLLVKAHAQVRSGQDLANFAKGILLENTQAEQISLNFEKIKMDTKGTGKLFGFIPVSFVQQIEVDTDGDDAGKVKVMLPWYGFLTKVDISAEEIEEEATKAVVENLGSNRNWDFGDRALALKMVSDVLKTKHDTAKNAVSNVR